MSHANLIKPNQKAVAAYYAALKSYRDQDVSHEGALETAFSRLLNDNAHTRRWTLIPKLPMKSGGKTIAPDGTLKDEFNLRRGYWEAKDTHDDLDKEFRKKIDKGDLRPVRQHEQMHRQGHQLRFHLNHTHFAE